MTGPIRKRRRYGPTVPAEEILRRCRRHKVIELVEQAASETGVIPRAVVARNSSARCVRARLRLYVLLREREWSYAEIGRLLDRLPSGVVHAMRRAGVGD